MKLKHLIIPIAVFAGLACATPARAETKPEHDVPQPPNVIVIVADQLRYQSTGYGGDSRAITPNLDRLAGQGINFRQCVANTPVCSAWRASFLTGKYASSTGVAVNELRLNPNQDSIAHMFARGGYACDLIGKWHLWATDSNHEEIKNAYTPPGSYRMGFDAFWAGYNFNHENYKAWYFRDTPEPHRIDGFGDAAFVDLACERLREHSKQQRPFFMTLALSAPHDPWTKHNIPPEWYERFKDVEFPLPATWSDQPDPYMDRNADPEQWTTYWKPHMAEFHRGYYALTAAVDEQVGRLLSAIDNAGMRDNTIVVFTSDHGEMLGAHGRVFKMTFYEESARTPLLIRWPGHIPAASSDACISTVDLMPTLLGLAGRDIPKAVEGRNLSRLVLGKGGPEPEAALLQGMGHTYLWKDGFEWRALRDQRFTYARYRRDGRELLFDNVADPIQQHDLAQVEAHRDNLKRLRNQMNQRLESIGDTFEKCSWYRDRFTENRVIVRGARGAFHREFGLDVPADTSPTKP
jgi:arylsulfatase A-like enzyme